MFLKRLSPFSLFSLTPSSLPHTFTRFCTSSPTHLTPASGNERCLVLWDFENCPVPKDVQPTKLADTIIEATISALSSGTCGITDDSIEITGFGDVRRIEKHRGILQYSGIDLRHIPQDKKESADKALITGLLHWVKANPAPGHVFLISGDKDFAPNLHCLKMCNYNTILATKEDAHSVLKCGANVMFYWKDLVRGETAIASNFYRPSRWYLPLLLDNPFITPVRATLEPSDGAPNEKLLSDHSFWNEFQMFMKTKLAYILIDDSKNRANLAYNLVNFAPSKFELKKEDTSTVFRIVDMLITEKKWVVETPYMIFPFRLSLNLL